MTSIQSIRRIMQPVHDQQQRLLAGCSVAVLLQLQLQARRTYLFVLPKVSCWLQSCCSTCNAPWAASSVVSLSHALLLLLLPVLHPAGCMKTEHYRVAVVNSTRPQRVKLAGALCSLSSTNLHREWQASSMNSSQGRRCVHRGLHTGDCK